MKRPLRYWETALVAAIILYGSLAPNPHVQLPPVQYADKWTHVLMYLALGAVLMWDMRRDGQHQWRLWLIAIAAPVAFGGIIEILQENFFYPRTGDWLDWTADIIGTLIGCLTAYFIYHWWHGRRTTK